MKCKKCKYYDNNYQIQKIDSNHPTYYEEMVYCMLLGESQFTEEDLQIKCPLKDK